MPKNFRYFFNYLKIYLRIITFKWVKLTISILCSAITLFSFSDKIREIDHPSFSILNTILIIVIAIVIALIITIPSIHKSYNVSGVEGVRLQLIYGDIMTSRTNLVVPTNTSFDTDPECIKESSIQGQICKRFYGNNHSYLGYELQKALTGKKLRISSVPEKKVGNNIRYSINTVVALQPDKHTDAQTFYWIAINDHDNDGNVPMNNICIKESIDCLWQYMKNNRKIRSIAVPIFGTGLTGVNQPTFDVFEYIVDSFIQMTVNYKIADTLQIYIYPKDYVSFNDFELADRYLKFRCANPLSINTKHSF